MFTPAASLLFTLEITLSPHGVYLLKISFVHQRLMNCWNLRFLVGLFSITVISMVITDHIAHHVAAQCL